MESILCKRFGRTSLHFPEPSCGSSSLVPRAQKSCLCPPSVPAADRGHTSINICSTMYTLPTRSLSLALGVNSPCQETYSAQPSICPAPAGLPVRPMKAISARGGHAAMTGSGSSLGRRFSSGGGQLKNLPCVMTGSCLKYPGGLRLSLFIPLTLTLTSFLPTSELTQSSPISCSSFHRWAPAPACCSAGLPCWVITLFLLLCMARTRASHTFLSSFPPALSRLEGTS